MVYLWLTGATIAKMRWYTVYPKKYAHGFVVLCFVVVMQSFIMNSHALFIHIHQGCFAGTGAIVRLPQCQWSKPDGYGKISQCITTTKHSKAKTVCIFLGIYCISAHQAYKPWSQPLIVALRNHPNMWLLSAHFSHILNYTSHIALKVNLISHCYSISGGWAGHVLYCQTETDSNSSQ